MLVVYGTRPEAIKLATIIQALNKTPRIECIVAVTGQHRQLLDQVHSLFQIKPDFDLAIMQDNQSLNSIAGRVLLGLEGVFDQVHPTLVLIHGDTTTAVAAALAAFNRHIPIVHVEAGLRSGALDCPFPEEANRRLIAQIARLHLAPTPATKLNLLSEGIPEENVVVTGNPGIDAFFVARASQDHGFRDPRVQELAATARERPIILVTMHRRENMGDGLVKVARAIASVARLHPRCSVIWPAHANPAIQSCIRPWLALPNAAVVEPMAYNEFIQLVCRASIIVTDSGGVQEEGATAGTPVLVARANTEREEAVVAGRSVLVGTDEAMIIEEVGRCLANVKSHQKLQDPSSVYGDGRAAQKCVDAIIDFLDVNKL